MHSMLSGSQAADEAAARRHIRNVVTNAQLRDIAKQQVG